MLALLDYLVEHRDRVVSREELIAAVWRGAAVGDGSLRRAIWSLRQLLDDSPEGQAIVQTVRGHGYRFVAAIEVERAGQAGADESESYDALGARRERAALELARPGFFGREEELARLQCLLEQSLAGEGRVCAVLGPAGVGKSRLVREAAGVLLAGQSFVEAHSHPDQLAPSFWPWLQVISTLLERIPGARERYRELAPAVFRLLRGVDPQPGSAKDADASLGQRFALLVEMRRLLIALASEAPGLLLIEDLQWADEASLSFLVHLLPELSRTRSLLVVTCRSFRTREQRPLARAIRAISRSAAGAELELRNLSRGAVTQLLAAQAGRELSATASEQIFAITDGHPLFVSELSRLLARREGEDDTPSAPDRVQIVWVIERRLDALPTLARAAVDAGAVLGQYFRLPELAGVLDEPAATTLERLDICIEQHVFVEEKDGRFRFTHPLLRESARASLRGTERSRLHLRAGEWLERHPFESRAVHVGELARHFAAAGPLGYGRKAMQYASECAELAYAATAYQDAAHHYQQALACAALDPELGPALHLELELRRGEALRASGADTQQVNQFFRELASRAELLDQPALFARAVLGYTGQRQVRFTPTQAPLASAPEQIELLERALVKLGPERTELRALLLCSMAGALFSSLDRQRREAAVREALAIANELALPWLRVRALVMQVYCCAAPDGREARVLACNQLVQVAREHNLPVQECDAVVTRAIVRLGAGDALGAAADVARARHLADKITLPEVRSRSELVELMRAFWEGDTKRARQLSEAAMAANPHDLVERGLFTLRLATVAMLEQGVRSQVVGLYEQLLAEHPGNAGVCAVLSTIYATLKQFERATSYFDVAAADDFRALPEDINWIGAMIMLADAALRLDSRERVGAVYTKLVPYGQLVDFCAGEGSPVGPVACWLAPLAIRLGRYEEAERWLEVADALSAQLGAPLFDALSKLARARLLLDRQPRDELGARKLVKTVHDFASRRGIGLLELAVRQLEQECKLELLADAHRLS